MDAYGQLKSLLLYEEREQISLLQEALNSLLEETRDPEQIINKAVPLINKIFSQTIQKDRQGFVKVFSPVINELLTDTIQKSSSEIAVALAPVMGKAISSQIKNQRDEMVDALYPIMGNMISKYVTESFKEMLNEINQKVQSTLSFETLKRKVIAKIKGISETELLLQDSTKSYSIKTVFLIHKETGILISERSLSGESSIEPDMVASMLTAIRSFVNDWISQSDKHFELNEIEYGDSTIRLEAAGCCYMATVLKGAINRAGQLKIAKVFEHIVESHAQSVVKFDGDIQTLALEQINSKLDELFVKEEDIVQKDKKGLIIISVILSIFIIAGFWLTYKSYIANQAESKARSIIYTDPQLNLYAINIAVEGQTLIIDGRLPEKSIHERLLNKIAQALPKLSIKDKTVFTDAIPTHEQTLSMLESIINTLNLLKGNQISFQFEKGVVELNGLVTSHHIYKELHKKISELKGVVQLISKIKEYPTGETIVIFYETGEILLDEKNKILLDSWFEENGVKTLLELYKNVDLLVIGYSDKYGKLNNNVIISSKRSRNVLEYLLQKGVSKKRITSIGVSYLQSNIIEASVFDKRCVQIKWVKR